MPPAPYVCCICKKNEWDYGNNPYPIKKRGKCCDVCNYEHVIPIRMGLTGQVRTEFIEMSRKLYEENTKGLTKVNGMWARISQTEEEVKKE